MADEPIAEQNESGYKQCFDREGLPDRVHSRTQSTRCDSMALELNNEKVIVRFHEPIVLRSLAFAFARIRIWKYVQIGMT